MPWPSLLKLFEKGATKWKNSLFVLFSQWYTYINNLSTRLKGLNFLGVRCKYKCIFLPFSNCSICSVEKEVLFLCSFLFSLSLICESSSAEELWSELPSDVASLMPSLPNSPKPIKKLIHFLACFFNHFLPLFS